MAIPTILNECPEVQVILMDDAFQHRAVVPQFSILVTDYNKPFYKDFLMPFGRLREAGMVLRGLTW
ncbi:MAG: tetraacyldisaccharide 4'-kinase [Flammeovirgaceae bacterium]|nr:tetraacyldisaccharide 4'-kinase [Flammeovirgaceae bacterium]